ncbi:MAG: diguanylate cyclase [Rhodanobacter sp.]
METPLRPEPATSRWYTILLAFGWCVACVLLAGIAPAKAYAARASAAVAPDEAGLPFIRNFGPTEYGGTPQNWSVIQDRRGVVYVGNVDGAMFSFDGSRWRRIPIPNRSAVRSLAMDANGRVYVGTVGDFGYLEPDAVGQMRYVSLLDQVPAEQRQFTDVWKTFASSHGIYFITRAAIFCLDKGVVKVWKAEKPFHTAFLVNDTVYVRQFDRGLMRMTDRGPELVAGGERFANEKIYVLLPWKGAGARPGDLLIGTRGDGWWLFDGKSYRRWSADADAATRGTALYDGIWLSNGQLAVAMGVGVLILDQNGHVVQRLNRSNGLADDAVNALFEDRQHGLWVTSDIGVSRISINAPITTFDERNGLTGAVIAVSRYQNKLYAGTTEGLFRLDGADSGHPHFTLLPAIKGAAWTLLDSGHGLLVGTTEAIYSINDDQITVARSVDPLPVSMLRSRRDPERVFIGAQDGLASMRWDGHRWLDEGTISDFSDEIRSMLEDDKGQLWLGTWNSSVLRVTPPPSVPAGGKIRIAHADRFKAGQGIPAGTVAVIRIDGELRVGTTSGILSFDPVKQRFEPDPRFARMPGNGHWGMRIVEQDAHGELWMAIEDTDRGVRQIGGALPDEQGNWRWMPTPLQPLASVNPLSILPESDGVIWIATQQGLFRYAVAPVDGGDAPFSTLLRAISTKEGAAPPLGVNPKSNMSIPYARNALRFEFAAPSFDTLDANRFQTQLAGLDLDWSPWTREIYRDYTNIPDGDYQFKVRAHNVYGELGGTASFDFHILSPWYRTWWAWTLWSALTALGLVLLVFWRFTALRKRNRTLVALVELRTEELQAAIRTVSEQSITDPLTGLKNRRYLYDHIEQDIALVQSQPRSAQDDDDAQTVVRNMYMAFLMVDIDHFKEVNDTYGHAAGDRVLQQVRDILLAAARDSDTPTRWGGEEFLILARFTKPQSGALLAERLRSMMAAHPFDLGNGVVIHRTCSIGFASYPFFTAAPEAVSWEQVVNMADECMYAAKKRGRNSWVGVKAGDAVPEDVAIALRDSLASAPAPGLLNILLPPQS